MAPGPGGGGQHLALMGGGSTCSTVGEAVSQRTPLKKGPHWQRKEAVPSTQVPPLRQGLGAQKEGAAAKGAW